MTEIALRESIKLEFSKVGLGTVDVDILSQCVGLASTCNVPAAQLAEIWESYSLNKDVSELNDITFKAFRAYVHKDAPGAADTAVISRTALSKRYGPTIVTPPAKRVQPRDPRASVSHVGEVAGISASPESPNAPPINFVAYNERTGAGKVILSFNPRTLAKSESTESGKRRCEVDSSFSTNVKKPFRHMFTTIEEKSRALDEHLLSMGEEIINRYAIGLDEGIADLEAVAVPRQDKVCCIGRICNEAHSGRINQSSVLLEGSRNYSHGERINVDLSLVKDSKASFSLFPGQIVALEGLNVSGRKMVVSRICEGASFPAQKSRAADLMNYHYDKQDGSSLKIMSVCGPYTTSDNLDYEPMLDLFNVIRAEKPDVAILTGPFVDMRHKLVVAGETMIELENGSKVSVSYETFFANKVASLLEELFENERGLHTQFVLVPSLDDAVAEWVYPQAPFTDRVSDGGKSLDLPNADGMETGTLGLQYVESAGREGGGPMRVHRVSNPCTIKINEVVVGVTSTDVLFHMNCDEASGNLEPGSRLCRIAQHLLQQRNYYPLFPPSPDTNLDLKRMGNWEMPCQPDLLIVPSRLTCFARTVLDSTVVVNPGQLSKGTTGGTYAIMEIHPIRRETLETADDVEIPHSLHDRIVVDVKRI